MCKKGGEWQDTCSLASVWVSSSMMHKVPAITLLYVLGTGLVEMVVLGIVVGLTLRPG